MGGGFEELRIGAQLDGEVGSLAAHSGAQIDSQRALGRDLEALGGGLVAIWAPRRFKNPLETQLEAILEPKARVWGSLGCQVGAMLGSKLLRKGGQKHISKRACKRAPS